MRIILNNSSMVPIYEQLMDQIKNEIISGSLAENEILPSVRSLSAELRISALTVKKAYDKLEEEGFVVTVHGKGTYVAATDKQLAVGTRLIQTDAQGTGIGSIESFAVDVIVLLNWAPVVGIA